MKDAIAIGLFWFLMTMLIIWPLLTYIGDFAKWLARKR